MEAKPDQSEPPLISIVIPTYNHAAFVAEAVETVLNQTYTNTEVIVVDDGSTDDTRQKLSRYDGRIKYHYQENRGLSAARNAGINLARGEWIALLDADDLWFAEKLEFQWRAILENPDCDLLASKASPNPPVGSVDHSFADGRLEVKTVNVVNFLTETPFGPSSVMMRTSVAKETGWFDENLRAAEDRDCWLRVSVAHKVLVLQTPLWWYRQHDAQMSRDADRMWIAYRSVLTNFFRDHAAYHGLKSLAFAYLHIDAAHCYHDQDRFLRSSFHVLRSILVHPRSIPRYSLATRLKLVARGLRGTFSL